VRALLAISTAFLLAVWLSPPAAGQGQAVQGPTVAGTWTGTADAMPGTHQTFTMVLKQNGSDVSGTYTTKFQVVGREASVRVKGSFTEDKLSLTVGQQGRLQATVSGDSMTGSLERGNDHPLRVSASRTTH